MPIDVNCTRCPRSIRAPDRLAGKKVKCPDCGQVVAVPAAQPNSSRPAGPVAGPAKPAKPPAKAAPKPAKSAPKPAKRPAGKRSAPQAPEPPPMAGVGDLLEEISTLEQMRQREQEEADYEKQLKDASFNAYMSPMFQAREKQQQSIHSHFANARRIDLGSVLGRSFSLFGSQFLMVMLAAWFTVVATVIGVGAIIGTAILIAYLAGATWNKLTQDTATTIFVALGVFLGGAILYIPYALWLRAGLFLYFLKLARGDGPEFADLVRGVRYVPSFLGAAFLYWLIGQIPNLPTWGLRIWNIFERPPDVVIIAAGLVALVLTFVIGYWLIKGFFFDFAIVDKAVGSVEAISISNQITTGNFLAVFVLLILLGAMWILSFVPAVFIFLPMLLPPAFRIVGIVGLVLFLPVFPLSMTILATAYVDMTGQTPVRRQP